MWYSPLGRERNLSSKFLIECNNQVISKVNSVRGFFVVENGSTKMVVFCISEVRINTEKVVNLVDEII